MTPELYQRAGELFEEVRELPESEWAVAIDSACGGDTELRDHVLWILNADRAATSGAFLDSGAFGSAARLLLSNLPSAGAVIGHFRLLEQIGSGGMGIIF
jgi:serine/threonine-protein kinase